MSLTRYNGHNVGWFYIETYKVNTEIIWPVDGAQVSKYIKHRFGLDYPNDDDFGARCIEFTQDGIEVNLICLRKWTKGDPKDAAYLAHEGFHVSQHILGGRGLKLARKSSEAYAYLLEEVVRRSMELLNKRK